MKVTNFITQPDPMVNEIKVLQVEQHAGMQGYHALSGKGNNILVFTGSLFNNGSTLLV